MSKVENEGCVTVYIVPFKLCVNGWDTNYMNMLCHTGKTPGGNLFNISKLEQGEERRGNDNTVFFVLHVRDICSSLRMTI